MDKNDIFLLPLIIFPSDIFIIKVGSSIPLFTSINNLEKSDADYLSFQTSKGLPVIKTHYGVFTELIKTDSLKNILNTTNNEEDLEHVTKYIYENPTFFQIKYLKTPNYIQSNKNIRLTIDTQKDFELLSEIYSKTSNRKNDLKSTFDYINLNKTLKKEMVNNILRNQKWHI